MAENDGGGDEGEATRQPAAAASAAPAAPPPRPTISLPARGGPFGFAGNASPGPMTLASRLFFSEDPDAECRSFTQLLAGAMASPSAMSRKLGNLTPGEGQVGSSGGAPEEKGSEDESAGGSGGGGLRQSQPVGTLVVPSPMFTIPPGLSPAGLLDSPGFFPSAPGYAGISHQQVLAQVTAQAAWSQSQMQNPPEYSAPLSTFTEASMAQPAMPTGDSVTFVQMPNRTADTNNATLESVDCYHSDQRSQPPTLNVDKPVDDGYNWRKYGQKQVKGSEYPRSYYKCTHPNCPVKKKVERSIDGQVTEIIYKGQHNHKKPPPGRRAREGGALPSEANGITDVTETGSHVHSRNFNGLNETTGLTSRREQESGQTTADHLSSSSDGEDVVNTELRTDEGDDNEPDSKRSRIVETGEIRQVSSQKAVTEPRIIVQTTSEVDLLDDGYRWRKYGQKVVKGNPNPRSYYKCTYAGCNVRKHVERASTDHKAVITTYEGKHNHDVPTARHSSHKMPNSSSGNVIQPKPLHAASNQVLLRTEFSSNNPHPVAEILRLKEEHDIT